MSVLNIRTQDQLIFIEKPVPILTSGNKNNDVLKVTFDETWDCENGKFYASFYIDDPKDADIISLTRNEDNSFTCLIPNGVLRKEGVFKLGVWCEFGDKTKTSNNKEIRVHQGAVTSNEVEENEIDIAVNSAKEEYRNELETSIETATGENHDNKTWEELNNTVAELPIITDEQTQALGDYDLIKDYFADFSYNVHTLFQYQPTDETGTPRYYRLPYLYTPKLKWSASACNVSQYLLEFGVDVSSATSLSSNSTASTFRPLPYLEKLTLTGNANNSSCFKFMLNNSSLRYLKMETPSKDVLNATTSYYRMAFYGCSKLQTIDCELDFTGQTDTGDMFASCTNLRNLRIKPFTLRCSLDVSACKYFIHPDIRDNSLLSILNAIPNPTTEGDNSNITIKYSNYGWEFETMGDTVLIPIEFVTNEVYFNSETGLYSWEKQTENDTKTTMYEAFTEHKGVTLAV